MKLDTVGINRHKLSKTLSLFTFVFWILVATRSDIIFLLQKKEKQSISLKVEQCGSMKRLKVGL